MFENWFIKNKKLLEENSRVENLIDLTSEIERFSIKLDSVDFSSMIWFIWKFWIWKSNFLNQIKNKYSENSKWFEFDAWKYPERANLWENFVLEFARQINKEIFDKTMKQVDWTINDDKKVLINTIWDMPWLSVIKNFNHFIKTTPAKRNFEIENLLSELINKIQEKNIYIILEDIDRSWDNWLYFLETLNHFLKNNEKMVPKIVVIVPIWKENYDKDDLKTSYLKSLDYFYTFSLKDIKLDLLVKELFIDEIYNNLFLKWQITSFLEWIFKEFPEQITMRLLKHILRNANSNYIALLKKQWIWIDWRLSILFETAKYIHNWNKNNPLFIDFWRSNKYIWWSESIFSALIWIIIKEAFSSYWWRPHESIYEKNNSQMIIRKMEVKYPLKIENVNYKNIQTKTPILYHNDNYDTNNNYFYIIEDYLD